MAKETDIILIKKFIAGECTSLEQEYVRQLLLDPEGQQLLDSMLDEDWKNENILTPSSDAFIDSFRQRVSERLIKQSKKRSNIRKIKMYRYAAIWVLFFLGFSAIVLWNTKHPDHEPKQEPIAMQTYYNPTGHRAKLVLSDSSVVLLGADSRIKYPNHFEGGKRELYLEGEAFFDVTNNPAKPFVIHSGDIQTTVLGTTFKIEAFDGDVHVAVATGKVRVDRELPETKTIENLAVLLPGKMMIWDAKKAVASSQNIAVSELNGWKEGKLIFNGIPLKKVVKVLERWYNVQIDIQDKKIAKYKMNMELDGNKPLKNSLELIKITTDTKYIIQGNRILIH